MTQDNDTETVEPQAQSEQDSPVIKALRKQIKDLEGQVKAAPDPVALRSELRDELARENAIKSELIRFGQPEGILDIVAEKLGESEVNHDAVGDALRGIGFKIDDTDAGSSGEAGSDEGQDDLAKIVDLSGEVSSLAGGEQTDSTLDKINEADSIADIAASLPSEYIVDHSSR